MKIAGEKVARLAREKFGSLRAGCEAAGVNYKTFNAQLNRGSRLTLDVIYPLCRCLGVTVEQLLSDDASVIGLSAQDAADEQRALAYNQKLRKLHAELIRHGTPPDCDDILNWLRSSGGRFTPHDQISGYVDVFQSVDPSDNLMKPHLIGRASLASLWIGIESASEYNRKVGQFSRDIIDASLMAHLRVQEANRYNVEDVTVYGEIDGKVIEESYRRVIAPVKDETGRNFNLVFAQLLPSIE
ncbi:hypothetical protein [Leisingera sp. M523]|uniref:hypothetical protein n=1 Tax=Leisingera sp. M523 TaxID=2867013 RepID=UPI0021A8E6B9|nr:hypothetical protein [Leisingera sp. M523]UWQ30223.1 hypothetical protein K3557_06720 [Leisingera sp. M523]